MTYTEVCSCGASVTMSGWGIREVDVSDWVRRHAECGKRKQAPTIPLMRRGRLTE